MWNNKKTSTRPEEDASHSLHHTCKFITKSVSKNKTSARPEEDAPHSFNVKRSKTN